MIGIQKKGAEKGQSMTEFALVMPILVMLLAGMVMAGLYAFRAAASDWGVFVTGVGTGTYNTSADEVARSQVLWADIRNRIDTGPGNGRQVQSQISIMDTHSLVFTNPVEAQRGRTMFRLWRFYPGPPPPGVNE